MDWSSSSIEPTNYNAAEFKFRYWAVIFPVTNFTSYLSKCHNVKVVLVAIMLNKQQATLCNVTGGLFLVFGFVHLY